jgi:hypothetical protein
VGRRRRAWRAELTVGFRDGRALGLFRSQRRAQRAVMEAIDREALAERDGWRCDADQDGLLYLPLHGYAWYATVEPEEVR